MYLKTLPKQLGWLYDLVGVLGLLQIVPEQRTGQVAEIIVILAGQPEQIVSGSSWQENTRPLALRNLLQSNPLDCAVRVTGQAGVEYWLCSINWASADPIASETFAALQNGYQILADPEGYLSALVYQFGKQAGTLLKPRIEISTKLAQGLISAQFPAWKDLPLQAVDLAGWCNGAFRLGSDLLVKIPRAQRYERSHLIENQWLGKLNSQLSYQVPEPVALGEPDASYPWHWTVYKWIPGETRLDLSLPDKRRFAQDLGLFLKCLWSLPAQDGPAFFEQTFFRGAPLRVYDRETREALSQLTDLIDTQAAQEVWNQALGSRWSRSAVWVHGDLFPGNILIQDNQLAAVIDFGSMCVGDPACDLAMAWTFFEAESRAVFKASLALDALTWQRARGWVLWKALITLTGLETHDSETALKNRRLIEVLIHEDQDDHALLFD